MTNCRDIIHAFELCGYSMNSGMGMSPLTWQEIDACNRCAGLNLSTWALTQIRKMSEVYCSSYYIASNNDVPPPNVKDYDEYVKYRLAESEKALFANRVRK